MNLRTLIYVAVLLNAPLAHGAAKPKPKAAVAHKPAAGAAKKTTAARKTPTGKKQVGKAVSHNAKYARGRNSRTKAPAKSADAWRTRQAQPTPERYTEIQQALASKGYLKSAPSGTWDAESQDAMRRFQQDQKLEASGKLNSRSLIGLGLGPAHATAAPPALPAAPTVPAATGK